MSKLPPLNGIERRRPWTADAKRWEWMDWDGDELYIDEYGGIRCETEAMVQPSAAQWQQIAAVAAHLATEVGRKEAEARAAGYTSDTFYGKPIEDPGDHADE